MSGHRWYDQTLGRFLSRDPIGFAGGLNLYEYGANSPVNYVDPSGLEPYDENKVFDYLIANGFDQDSAEQLQIAARRVNEYDPNPKGSIYNVADMMRIATPLPSDVKAGGGGRTRPSFPWKKPIVQLRQDVPSGYIGSEADVYRVAIIANELYHFREIKACGDPGTEKDSDKFMFHLLRRFQEGFLNGRLGERIFDPDGVIRDGKWRLKASTRINKIITKFRAKDYWQ